MFEFNHTDPSGNGPSHRISKYNSTILKAYPEPKRTKIPDHIPENVETPLNEAEESFYNGLYSAAGACYRKAMERSLKHLNPAGKGMLHKRIRALEGAEKIPSSMIDLLDEVKLFGNESMHEDDLDPTEEDASAARDFAHLFLTYAFTMPAQVNAAKIKRLDNAES